jgi:hypothetical protein
MQCTNAAEEFDQVTHTSCDHMHKNDNSCRKQTFLYFSSKGPTRTLDEQHEETPTERGAELTEYPCNIATSTQPNPDHKLSVIHQETCLARNARSTETSKKMIVNSSLYVAAVA